MSIRHIFAVILIALSVALVFGAKTYFGFLAQSPAKRLETIWLNDTKNLEAKQKLPKQWQEISEVEVNSNNPMVYDWLNQIDHLPYQIKKGGTHKLQVMILHWIDGYRYGVVVQYHLVDIQTNNTIWELGRTYNIGYIY